MALAGWLAYVSRGLSSMRERQQRGLEAPLFFSPFNIAPGVFGQLIERIFSLGDAHWHTIMELCVACESARAARAPRR